MTDKLETLFNLPPAANKEIVDALENAHQIESSLPQVSDDTLDKELDDIANQAVESFENLQSLGMNVEARFAAPIFEAAGKMLGHAVTAKLGKVQKKLKQTEILLKMQKMQHDMNKDSSENNSVDVDVKVFDRNELLNSFRKKQ